MYEKLIERMATEATITHGGKTYTLANLDDEIAELFETWLMKRAIETLRRVKSAMDAAEYEKRMGAIIDGGAAGKYGLFGEVGVTAIRTDAESLAQLTWLLINKNHREVTLDDVEHIIKAQIDEARKLQQAENAKPYAGQPPIQQPRPINYSLPPGYPS